MRRTGPCGRLRHLTVIIRNRVRIYGLRERVLPPLNTICCILAAFEADLVPESG